jgi:hypothetical protein
MAGGLAGAGLSAGREANAERCSVVNAVSFRQGMPSAGHGIRGGLRRKEL